MFENGWPQRHEWVERRVKVRHAGTEKGRVAQERVRLRGAFRVFREGGREGMRGLYSTNGKIEENVLETRKQKCMMLGDLWKSKRKQEREPLIAFPKNSNAGRGNHE
jgi:hypothetical protein